MAKRQTKAHLQQAIDAWVHDAKHWERQANEALKREEALKSEVSRQKSDIQWMKQLVQELTTAMRMRMQNG